jgi:hypothetical protein
MDVKDLILEEKCEACEGSGRSYEEACPACRGHRYVPTELGDRILALLSRHFPVES